MARVSFSAREENPQAKLIANARNDKLFTDGSDLEQLAREVRYVISGQEDVSKAFQTHRITVELVFRAVGVR